MECHRCPIQPLIHAFAQANLDNSLGRMKTKQVIAAVRNLQSKFATVCTACQNVQDNIPSEPVIANLRKAWNTHHKQLLEVAGKHDDETDKAIEELQAAFQTVCFTCAHSANDDNPSNHGQTFVSLDSGNCRASSGHAKSTATDDNLVQARADWIGLHASPDFNTNGTPLDPADSMMAKEDAIAAQMAYDPANDPEKQPVTEEFKTAIRTLVADFVGLEVFDKMLVCCVMSGMNIAEFARMLWLPYSIVNPKTRQIKSITKQAAHARWNNIVKKFPLMNLLSSQRANNKERIAALLADPNSAASDNQFSNGRMTRHASNAIEKLLAAQTLKEQKEDRQRQREQKQEDKIRKIVAEEAAKKKAARKLAASKKAIANLPTIPGFDSLF